MVNSLASKKPFSVAIQTEGYKRLIENTLRDPKRRARFVAAITSAVSVNKDLQSCDPGTILSCGFLGESLALSPSPQLGQYYMVPFRDNKNNRNVATFVLGYKGYLQLAIRSGQYKDVTVTTIKDSELVKYNPISGEILINPIEDEKIRNSTETIGYYASLEYLNGFRKSIYWSKEKMLQHADRYSKAFKAETYQNILSGKVSKDDLWKNQYSSFWYKDFDQMAQKTMLRQLISKWGIMSIEMITAFESDNAVIKSDLSSDLIVTPEAFEDRDDQLLSIEHPDQSEEIEKNELGQAHDHNQPGSQYNETTL